MRLCSVRKVDTNEQHDYSSNMLLSKMKAKASALGIGLTKWDYDAFFWNPWNSTEKGLS